MTVQTNSRTTCRPILATMATLIVGLISLLGMPGVTLERAEAHPADVPYHEIGQWFYDASGLGARPPRIMSSYANVQSCYNAEQVKWSPDLYRWNGQDWVLYDGTAPWYEALTTRNAPPYGYCYMKALFGYWWNPWNHVATGFHRFGALPPGYYIIKNYMYWGSLNRTHSEWSNWFTVR